MEPEGYWEPCNKVGFQSQVKHVDNIPFTNMSTH